jgi:maltose alpha-D-glucosyltransferase/alpha-amylase
MVGAHFMYFEDEIFLMIFNLSDISQCVKLDLSDYSGMQLVDIYKDIIFHEVDEVPFLITINPYAFYYFKFQDAEDYI